MKQQVIGIIGGSGLYEIDGLSGLEHVEVDTPFGRPSDQYLVGELEGRKLVFLARHGRGHRLAPNELNYRANVHGFLQLGARWLLSVSAVGSMREEIKPGEFVIVDQFFDRTKNRVSSFFGDGIVGHVPFADPICGELAGVLHAAAERLAIKVHRGGTYLCIEGPQFSTRAESRIYRSWGVDVIGMTNLTEAKLAREAGLCYATVAMVTDYDCWHEEEEDVSVQSVLALLRQNAATAATLVTSAAAAIPPTRACSCGEVPRRAVLTMADAIDPQKREQLALILGGEDQ